MAAQPAFPRSYTPTGTAWPTRSGAQVYRIASSTGGPELWFCGGCLTEGFPRPGDLQMEAQEHADGCNAVQV